VHSYVKDVMTTDVVAVRSDASYRDMASMLRAYRVSGFPVVDGQGRLVGIVSRSHVLSVFSRPDEQIRREITQDVIADGFFTDPDRFTITVQDGIVTLAGSPGSVVLGNNIVDQVRHVEGVVAVHDQFTYPD
jgi:CBS domain-containing protein